jgi:hypothetical protein
MTDDINKKKKSTKREKDDVIVPYEQNQEPYSHTETPADVKKSRNAKDRNRKVVLRPKNLWEDYSNNERVNRDGVRFSQCCSKEWQHE